MALAWLSGQCPGANERTPRSQLPTAKDRRLERARDERTPKTPFTMGRLFASSSKWRRPAPARAGHPRNKDSTGLQYHKLPKEATFPSSSTRILVGPPDA